VCPRAGASDASDAYDEVVTGRIDLNADMGESVGPWSMGDDAALVRLVTSVNVACGFHAGDPVTIRRTVRLALDAGALVGAHPGYPDLVGFGRRAMDLDPEELEAAVLYQVAALDGIVRAEGGRLAHVKPHGALYHRAAADGATAAAVVAAVARIDDRLRLVGPAGSTLLVAAAERGLRTTREAFADRAYEPDGRLRGRNLPGALHTEPSAAAVQAVSIARDGVVLAADGSPLPMEADTLCIHGDTPGAAAIARAVRGALLGAGIAVRAPDA
jgi:5-oxoprolinase (ATP-hydrolysing) subunit A